ncbi:MAG: ABC1 kinase family protein, partial [Nocardioidaceae bacterium]
SDLLEEFRKSLMDELDYRREAENLTTIGTMLADRPSLVVPKPFPDFSSGRVLTMEYVAGKKITDLGPLGQLELDGAPLADELFSAYLEQVLVDGIFHADPHPGNLLVTDDGRLALLDIGMVARLAPAYRDRLVKLFLALADSRPDEVARIARTMGEELHDFDPALFERAVTDVVGRSADASLSDLDVGAMLLQLTRRAGEAGLKMDPELVMLGKTLLNLDQVAATLDPGFEPRDALRRHTTELMRSSMKTSPAAMFATVLEAKEFVEALPGRVNRAFDAIGHGHFELRVKAFDEDEFLRGLHKLANVIAAGLILAAMILASALLARSPDGNPTAENRIALVVFVVSVLVALGMLSRIFLQTRHVRSHRRT